MQSKNKSRLIVLLVLISSIGFTTEAQAKCTKKNLKGTWYAHLIWVDSTTNEGVWLNCKIKTNGKGKFVRTTSQCTTDAGIVFTADGVINGKSNCKIDPSTISLYDITDTLFSVFTMDFGIIDKGKTVVHGVGHAGTSEPFIVIAAKKG